MWNIIITIQKHCSCCGRQNTYAMWEYQDDSWSMLKFANTSLASVLSEQHIYHFAIEIEYLSSYRKAVPNRGSIVLITRSLNTRNMICSILCYLKNQDDSDYPFWQSCSYCLHFDFAIDSFWLYRSFAHLSQPYWVSIFA